MNSPCDVQQLHTPVHRYAAPVLPPGSTPVQAATRDDSTLPEVAQLHGGETKTPLESVLVDSPSPLHSAATPVPPPVHEQHAPTAETMRASDAIQDTIRNNDNSDPPIHSDGIVDPNISQIDKNKNITDASFPVISSADYETDAEFSGMFLYLHDGTLSGNVKKDKPILIMEDRYMIDEDGLLYRVDTPRQKNLVE